MRTPRRFPRPCSSHPPPHQINEDGRARQRRHRANRQFRGSSRSCAPACPPAPPESRRRSRTSESAAGNRCRTSCASGAAPAVPRSRSRRSPKPRGPSAPKPRCRPPASRDARSRPGAAPPARRSESNSDRTTSRKSLPPQARIPGIIPRTTAADSTAASSRRSPISQNAIPRRSRPLSVVIKNMMIAERNDAATIPASSSVALSSCPPRRPRK